MIKKKLLKLLPYLAAIITGVIFYFLAIDLNENFYDLLINISATFFAIPLLYFFYETAKSFSHKKLNKEIIDYAKMQADRELLSVINQLQKIIYTLDEKDFSQEKINKLLSINKEEIEGQIRKNKYLGFQIFKHWEVSEKGLNELLKNPFILEKMEDEQIISLINIFGSLRSLDMIQKVDKVYLETGEISVGYKIISGEVMNPENKKYPDRQLLLKHLSQDKSVVYDFGDIPKYNLDKCLNYYKVNDEIVEHYAKVIFDILHDINLWLDATGKEFVVDIKMFRIRGKHIT